MLKKKEYKFWFCTGSQELYGDECLAHVAEHAKIIVEKLNESGVLPYEVVWKPTLITNELIRKTFLCPPCNKMFIVIFYLSLNLLLCYT